MRLFWITLFAFFNVDTSSQEIHPFVKEAQQLERQFNDQAALNKYLEASKAQPGQITTICKISELYSVLGKRQKSKEQEKAYNKAAKQYAEQALRMNPNSSDANFVMSVAMGRAALSESGQAKINAVKDIKRYAEKAIQLDPGNARAYHVLARWHLEVSSLSSFEKWLVKVTFGALPAASLDDAIKYYEKSKQLNPQLLQNYLDLARCFQKKEEETKALTFLQVLQKMPANNTEEQWVKQEGSKLLKELQD